MCAKKQAKPALPELGWLAQVQEVRQPLSASKPIWIRHDTITSGPARPHPERHPVCELNVLIRGKLLHFSEGQKFARQAGDVFLAGPGVPHTSKDHQCPLEWISVYFEPNVLLELAPTTDAWEILQRVLMTDQASSHYIRATNVVKREWTRLFLEIAEEFQRDEFGSQLRLRALLLDLLVQIMRFEIASGYRTSTTPRLGSWTIVERALRFFGEHYSRPIYAKDVAAAAGATEASISKAFRECLGIPWVQYLQNYRVHRAAELLAESGYSVTEAALAVGMDDLSHFTKAFRTYMGMSPGMYLKNRR